MTPTDPGSAGELHVSITGDITALLSALDQAQQAAATAGTEIAQALSASATQGFDFGDKLAEQFSQASAASEAAGAMISTNLEQVATAETAVAENSHAAASGIVNVGESAHAASEGLHEAGNAFEALVEHAVHFLELVGVTLALEEIAREALLAVSATQQLTQSLTFLTGSSIQAAMDVEELKKVAVDLHVPFEQLYTDMQRVGPALGGFQAALPLFQGAAAAAHTLGLSFEEMVSKLDRIAISGTVSSRVLASMQLTLEDLNNATKSIGFGDSFKALDSVADRIAVIDEVMKRFAGDNALYAETLAAKWTDFRNQFGFAMEGIGAALEPVAAAFLEFVQFALASIIPVIEELATAFGQAFAEIARASGPLVAALKEIAGAAVAEMLSGLAGAIKALGEFATAATEATAKILDLIPGLHGFSQAVHDLTGMSLVSWLKEVAAQTVDFLFHFREIEAILRLATAGLHLFGNEAANTGEMTKTLDHHFAGFGETLGGVELKLKSTKDKFKDVSDELTGFGDRIEKAIQDLPALLEAVGQKIDKAITFDKFEKGLIDLNQIIDTETKAATKNLDALIESMKRTAAGQTEEGQNLIKILEDERAAIAAFVADRAFEDLGNQIDRYAEKSEADAARLQTANLDILSSLQALALASRNTDLQFSNIFDPAVQASVRLNEALKRLKIDGVEDLSVAAAHAAADFDVMLQAGTLSAGKIELGFERVYQSLVKLKTSDAMEKLSEEAAKFQASAQFASLALGDQYSWETKILQSEIQMAAARGESADKVLELTMNLEKVKIQQGILRDQTMGLSDLYSGMMKAFGDAWTGVEKGIAGAIVSGQSFGQVMQNVLTQLETKLTELVVKFFLDGLKDAILQNTSALEGFGKLFSSLFGGAAAGGGAVSGSADKAAGVVQQALQQTMSTVLSLVSALGSVITAISSIIGNFQMSHMNKLLGEMEVTTRGILNTLAGGDGVAAWTKLSGQYLGDIDQFLQGDLMGILVHISSDLDSIADNVMRLGTNTSGGSQGTSQQTSAGFSSTASAFSSSMAAMSQAVTTFTPNADNFNTAVAKGTEGIANFNSYMQAGATYAAQLLTSSPPYKGVLSAPPILGSMGAPVSGELLDANGKPRPYNGVMATAPTLGSMGAPVSGELGRPYNGAESTGSFVNHQPGSAGWNTGPMAPGSIVQVIFTGNAITSQDSAQRLAATMVAALRNNASLKL